MSNSEFFDNLILILMMIIWICFMERNKIKILFQRIHSFIRYYIIKRPSADWRTRKSIYYQIKRNKKNSTLTLIDEKPLKENEFKFAYGMADAVMESNQKEIDKLVKKLFTLLKIISKTGSRSAGKKFYTIVTSVNHNLNFGGISDAMSAKLRKEGLIVYPYLYYYARELATHSTDRNAVKMGLRIMSVCAEYKSIKIATVLGRHEEFAIYASNLIINVGAATKKIIYSNLLFKLLKNLHGWGRIQNLRNCAGYLKKQKYKDWIFYEGYKNDISSMETSLFASAYGDIVARLEPKTISQKTFDTATDLIDGLLERDIEYYNPILETFTNYIRHCYNHNKTIYHYSVLLNIKQYLEKNKKDEFKTLIIELNKILSDKKIKDIIIETANIPNATVSRYYANKLAKIYKINLFDIFWKQLLIECPLDKNLWFYVMDNIKPKDIGKVLLFAKINLDLKSIASGPTTKIFDTEPKYNQHDILRYIIQGLYNFKSAAKNKIIWELIITAINNPIVGIRNQAITLIEEWGGKDKIPANILKELKKQIKNEVDDKIKQRWKTLLKN